MLSYITVMPNLNSLIEEPNIRSSSMPDASQQQIRKTPGHHKPVLESRVQSSEYIYIYYIYIYLPGYRLQPPTPKG